jgi:hypothetical protein
MLADLSTELVSPSTFHDRDAVMRSPSAAPARPGLYAWYFSKSPQGIDTAGCHVRDRHALLYVGISPSAPPANGKAPSRSHLKQRLRTHYGGNAAGSTLRLTLGCLLSDELGIQLRRVGSGGRFTFSNPGEQRLDAWMQQHAKVVWIEDERPWEREAKILASGLRLPLNIAGNTHASVAAISALRREMRAAALLLPILADSGGSRR